MADDKASTADPAPAASSPLDPDNPPEYVRFHAECGGVLPSETPDDLDSYPDARAEWILIVGLCGCLPPREPWTPPKPGELTWLAPPSAAMYAELRALGDLDEPEGEPGE